MFLFVFSGAKRVKEYAPRDQWCRHRGSPPITRKANSVPRRFDVCWRTVFPKSRFCRVLNGGHFGRELTNGCFGPVRTQFGGFAYFRSLMGFPPWQPKRKWNEATITAHLLTIGERMGRFPKDVELSSDLRNAIHKNSVDGSHDLNYYRMKLGYPITKKSIGYWTEDTIQNELKKILSTHRVFPTNSFLIKKGRYDLSAAIQQSGGFNTWRQKLGYPIIQHSPNQYTDETIKEWLRRATLEKGRVPTQKELRQLDSRNQAAVAHRGGVMHYLTLLADKEPSMRGYLQSYRHAMEHHKRLISL